MRSFAGLPILMALALTAGQGAVAAPPEDIPPPTREEVQRAAPERALMPSHLTVEPLAPPPCPLAATSGETTTVLGGVVFEGVEEAAATTLKPAYEALVDRKIAPPDLCGIRDAAAAILARQGYIAAVEIPPQRLSDGGIARLRVVMARLVGFEVRGVAGRRRRLVEAYLRALVRPAPFNTREAERKLLLARDLPGLDITFTLVPAQEPGEVIADVSVKARPLDVQLGLQNYGSGDTGRWGVLAAAQAANLIAAGDQLSLGLFSSTHPRRQIVVQSAYDARIGHDGLGIGLRFTDAWIRTRAESGLVFRSHTIVGSLLARYPLVRSQRLDIAASGGLDVIDQDLRAQGFLLTRDRLRTAFLLVDFGIGDTAREQHPPRWRAGGALEVRKGLAALGASRGCGSAPAFADCAYFPTISRLDADPQAALVRFSGSAEARVMGAVSIAFTPRAQYAFAPLLGYEQFSGGAYTIGRGYDPGAAIGDSGMGLATELRYGALQAWGKQLTMQPYAFVDAVRAWIRSASTPGDDGGTLISAGGGVRAMLGSRVRADLALAVPLRTAPSAVRRGDTRVLLSVSTRLSH
ncbi:ShlB/FhaC/HecB family hemolysin secretion/activation protein [Sphingomonas bacterium]|uniref:ShlB/FhaC/HecB family hemolysin secretion/activation protein n=1 Tax=Sphingomonas bacterium TaxID=1895847 RepID=UPI0015761EBD|nr:ShlB/FhaC/HecB family hemolysin secretion/activation protein [Sphingomonas bacterium]